jgi:hypothetical protein
MTLINTSELIKNNRREILLIGQHMSKEMVNL